MTVVHVERTCGAVLVQKDIGAEIHNYWFAITEGNSDTESESPDSEKFDTADDGKAVFAAEVIHYDGNEYLDAGRHYVDDMSLTDDIRMAMNEFGFKTIYDLQVREI